MLSRAAVQDLPGGTSPDQSSCSCDTGDVLIRSTRVQHLNRRHDPGPGPGSVHVTVQKLPSPPPAQSLCHRTEKQQPKPRHKENLGAPARAAAERQLGVRRSLLVEPGATKKNRQDLAAESSPDTKLHAGAERGRHPGTNLLTSRFMSGGRGLVLAALKQRSHSATHRREVKVQLLDPELVQPTTIPQDNAGLMICSQDVTVPETSSQSAAVPQVHTEVGLSVGHQGDTTNSAAVAAAAVVAAAAPLIKAQSDMEARVSQLVDGIEKLLHADRVEGSRGRGSDHPTLQHLERLHSQQLQLQSQLLESALRMLTGNSSLTSTDCDLMASRHQEHLHVTHLDAAENVFSKQRSFSATRAASAASGEKGSVSLVTAHRDRWTEQTRPGLSVSKAPAHKPGGTALQSSSSDSHEAVRKADEVLREMGRLKSEMTMLLTPEDSVRTTLLSPDPLQCQPKQSQSNQHHSHQGQAYQKDSHQNQSLPQNVHFHQSVTQKSQSPPNSSQFQKSQTPSRKFQYHQSLFQEIQSKCNNVQPSQYKSVPVQKRSVVPSMLEEAVQILHQVRRQKKVLEENLEALLRAKAGDVLQCQLDALAANRDWTDGVRIKKTVDAWINTLTQDIQAEISEDALRCRTSEPAVTSHLSATESFAHSVRRKPVSTFRGKGIKTTVGGGGRAQTAGRKVVQESEHGGVKGDLKGSKQVEQHLARLYRRAPYEGLRRTLKKSPYLRFSSPATSPVRKPRPRLVESVRGVKLKSCKTQTGLSPPLSPSPVGHNHHTCSSTHMTSSDHAEVQLVSMAIPLGRPRVESSRHLQKVTIPAGANVIAVEAKTPEQQSQKLSDEGETLLPPSHAVNIERKSEDEEDKDIIFHGTHFLSVADVVEDELSVSMEGEEALELYGGPSPHLVQHQGTLIPPQPPPALPAQNIRHVLGLEQQRDALETRLVEWVEQQLMSRMISKMYRLIPSDYGQNVFPDHSELEQQSVASDIGLQLFVDSNIEVDSALVRQLVDEVLIETVSLMLEQRNLLDTQPEPELQQKPCPLAAQEEKLVTPIPTPVPTPPPSPFPTDRDAMLLTTPPSSEPLSQVTEESPQPIAAHGHVATPTSSPGPASSAGTPPAPHHVMPPLTWGNAELPWEEERPEEHMDPHHSPLPISIAEDEPPLSSSYPPPAPSPSPPSPVADPRTASLSSCSEEASSSTGSSRTVTEAVIKHISEGELFVSFDPRAALADDVVCSFASSLQELQDMDLDPPSEGQVRGQDLTVTSLPIMGQQGERPQPEGSWERQEEEDMSVGEVRANQTSEPYPTSNPSKSTSAGQNQTSTPQQISQCADISEFSLQETDQGSVSMGDLMLEPLGALTSDLQTELSLSPLPPPHLKNPNTAVQVKQENNQTAQPGSTGTRRMDVHLPYIRPDRKEVMEEADSPVN